jgi:predicted nucleic acid-binding protein
VTSVLVDTSAFFALTDRSDVNHARARKALARLGRDGRELLTTTYVLDETLTLVRLRLGHPHAVTLGEKLMASTWCRILDISAELRQAAWEIFVRHSDQTFSFTDCTSFAVMRAMRLSEAFTFDRGDFGAAGFVVVPPVGRQ